MVWICFVCDWRLALNKCGAQKKLTGAERSTNVDETPTERKADARTRKIHQNVCLISVLTLTLTDARVNSDCVTDCCEHHCDYGNPSCRITSDRPPESLTLRTAQAQRGLCVQKAAARVK